MTLANHLTILRIVLVPVFIISFLQSLKNPAWQNWMLGIFSFAILTDLFDGLAARLLKQKTALGSFLDPLADKLLITSTFITFAFCRSIDLWVFVIIFSRDLLIVLGWTIVYVLTGSSKIEPRFFGKACVLLQMAYAICILFPLPQIMEDWMMRAMIATTVISAIDYVYTGSKKLELTPK